MRIPQTTFAAPLVLVLFSVACGGGTSSAPTSPSSQPSAPFSQTDLRVGTGAEAVAGRTLLVGYTLWLYDPGQPENKGRQIEANQFSFPLGAGRVIRGWDQGLVGMRVGGLRRLVIPPDLAYGANGSGPIPPNATLVFDVELLALQ
jgi:FKBP-type peptidyl-prolyl cis-trans isomerase FkpA